MNANATWCVDPRDPLGLANERIEFRHEDRFTHVTWGDLRWCFPTTRDLTFDERRTFDALAARYREQVGR